MHIVLITGHQYPVGTALANRVRSYLEELADMGNKVQVIIYRPSEQRGCVLNGRQGELNQVTYTSSAHSLVKNDNPFVARLTWIYGYINCLRMLRREHKKKPVDVIIQASAKSSIIPLVYLFCRKNNCKYVLENSEYPWFILKKRNLINLIDKLLYLHVYYRLFDGVLAMTKALYRYHERYSKKSAQIFHLPMTVDIKRFQLDIPREDYVTYVGNNSYTKDGVKTLAESFVIISNEYPDWKLRIIGDTGHDGNIRSLFSKYGLSPRLEMLGNVHRDHIPKLLCQSRILALARPANLQAEGGFPTKLGEYLATGNLVVVTAVGEIPEYLEDGVSALIAKPDSVDSFSQKLHDAVEHCEQLQFIGDNGKTTCDKMFNSRVQGKRLDAFLRLLVGASLPPLKE